MSLYTQKNMFLAAGIIAWILLLVIVFKKEKFTDLPVIMPSYQLIQWERLAGNNENPIMSLQKLLEWERHRITFKDGKYYCKPEGKQSKEMTQEELTNALKNNNCKLVVDGTYKYGLCLQSPCTPD